MVDMRSATRGEHSLFFEKLAVKSAKQAELFGRAPTGAHFMCLVIWACYHKSMSDFISELRAISPFKGRSADMTVALTNAANAPSAPAQAPQEAVARQQQVTNRSGGNINFPGKSANISENYKNAFMDAIKFYQGEFKVTPHADIHHDPTQFGEKGGGYTLIEPNNNGQHDIILRDMAESDEKRAKKMTPEGIDYVPTHELGHALFNTLFPSYDTSSSAITEGNSPLQSTSSTGRPRVEKNRANTLSLVQDAMKDMGTKNTWVEEAKKITDYATKGPEETIAEALTDYYYHKNEAAPLSKAIVNRLKSKGALYGINQTGGVDLSPTQYSFFKNMRKYSPLK